MTAAKVLHRAWSRPKSMIVVVSPTERQSGEFLMKVKEFACRLGVRPRGDGVNRVSLLLPNGSRIVGLPGREGTSRGYSAVSLMIVDEAAKVLDELYYAVQPMLATTDGDLWLLSTPRGARGFFWEVWTRGDAEWERVSVKATECPRIPASFLEKQKRDYPDWRYRQEYLCEFSETEEALFDREMLMRAIRADVKPLWGPGAP